MSENETVARLENVVKDYPMGITPYRALHGIDFEVYKGDFLALIGPSGAGKSTILHIMGALDLPSSGKSYLGGRDIALMKDEELSALRLENLGFIFQEFNIIEVLTVYENVEYPLNLTDRSRSDTKERVDWILNQVGLYTHKDHKSKELSGGQRQRVAIARALVNSPKLVLADEPTASLDRKTGESILDLMQKLNEESRVTFLFATHDEDVMKYARKKIKIVDGKIIGEVK